MLSIYIKDLAVEAKHGVHSYEKEHAQHFVFNVEAEIDTPAAHTDKLDDTLNYTELKDLIIHVAQSQSFDLIERLAQAIADQILSYPQVQRVVIAIDKPDVFTNGMPGVRLELTRRAAD